jgi:hypothetical protein
MYKATQEAGANGTGESQAGAQQPQGESASANDNVTDAEF